MTQLDRYFDRTGRVRRPPFRRLGRELASLLFHHPALPDNADIPDGGGHVVLVLPAFMSPDFATAPLRRFLNRCGYRARTWGLGVNVGPTPRILNGLHARLHELQALEGGPVSVIGISLGGLLARHLAHEFPAAVAQVITLASPFRLPTAATIEPLFGLVAPGFSHDVDFARVAQPLPVPALSIFTKEDGIVAWESCHEDGESCEALEMDGPHTTIGRHPGVLRAVGLRLHEGRLQREARQNAS
jgi:hypothetical protein